MRFFFASLMLMSVVAVQGISFQAVSAQVARTPALPAGLTGRWRVKFTLAGVGEKNLVFDSQAKGTGSFLLLDAGPDDKSVAAPLPAAWAQTTNDRVSFSGEVELPIGTCCRETGTLLFKGKIVSGNSITGKAIFITSTIDEENSNGLRTMVGTFTASLVRDSS
ncbi:MAG TPA: hypothetical protein VN920_04645 [Pyrinomonadaceae bacterium]|nr:hypothetical protein [Pyrinomonadaceae bacterium]